MGIRVAILCLSFVASALHAETGREIVDAAQKEHGFSTWKDRTLSAVMESYDGTTLTRERDIDVQEQTDPRGDHKTFIEFKSPADVQGTLFLHLSPRGARDEQWLFTLVTRRARRLAEAQQDENFFGSDLSYRDLELIVRIQQWTEAEAAATLEPAPDTVDGHQCHVVGLVPAGHEEFPYRRYRLWFATADRLLWRVDVYDADDVLVKRVVMKQYEQIGRYTTATAAEVTNVPQNTHTAFTMSKVTYDQGLPESTFSISRLSKGQ